MSFESGFLEDAIKRFKYYKDLGDKTFGQLAGEDFFRQPDPESNSIAVIVRHMHGNMLSRWTNFLMEDGEKDWRRRDAEFSEGGTDHQSIISLWEEGWKCMFDTLEALQPADLTKTVTIRTEPLTVYDAILRQLAHYPYHVGQIVYLGRLYKSSAWKSLSIPKGGSDDYLNSIKSAQQK